jgi:uncharacterized membrane protein
MPQKISIILSFSLVILIIFFAGYVNVSISQPITEEHDIYYSYVEGKRLVEGENPYARILEGDMRKNQKYATYFPVFYELSYLSQRLGLQSFTDWMNFWRVIFIIFEFAIAVFLYIVLARRNLEWAGVFAAAFWMFNRWTLDVVRTANLDFIPIFLLLVSLEFFPRKKGLSLFLFGLSLGFKQIAIFLVPLYLIWEFRLNHKDWLKQIFKSTVVIASVSLITALPFLIWNASAFIKSVLFSATRLTGNHFPPLSLDVLLGWDGLPARFVMLALMALIYITALKGYGKKYFAALLIMAVFLGFNTVLFSQYQAWVIPFFPLVFLDFDDSVNPAEQSKQFDGTSDVE